MKQRLISLLLTSLFLMGLTACRGTEPTTSTVASGTTGPSITSSESLSESQTTSAVTETSLETETTAGSSAAETTPETSAPVDLIETRIDEWISSHSLSEQVAQLFVCLADSLLVTDPEEVTVQYLTDEWLDSYQQLPAGGIIIMGGNIGGSEELRVLNQALMSASLERTGLPLLLATDEEGGSVARLFHAGLPVTDVGDMRTIGAGGDPGQARQAGETIGRYLADYGFNVDFAPVADVLLTDSALLERRSFGTDPALVADMSVAFAEGLRSQGIAPTAKHFPGHGATADDTHLGLAVSNRSREQIDSAEIVPFKALIAADVPLIMTAHITVPALDSSMTPASLSHAISTDYLRGELGYQGLVITDSLDMDAIAEAYAPGEAAIMAIEAGADLILAPDYIQERLNDVVQAIESGRISQPRIEDSLRRILRFKIESL